MGYRRGQAAMEYLLVTAFAFLLLIPIIIIAYTQSSRFEEDVAAAQIQKVGNAIIDGVDSVYYAGPPAKRTLKLHFPDGIQSITITDATIVFTVQGTGGAYEYALSAATNMTGAIGTFQGTHTITITAGATAVSITDG